MPDLTATLGAVGNGNNVRGPERSPVLSRALLRAASRSRRFAGGMESETCPRGLDPASRRGPKISSVDLGCNVLVAAVGAPVDAPAGWALS